VGVATVAVVSPGTSVVGASVVAESVSGTEKVESLDSLLLQAVKARTEMKTIDKRRMDEKYSSHGSDV